MAVGARDRRREPRDGVDRRPRDDLREDVVAGRAELQARRGGAQLGGQ